MAQRELQAKADVAQKTDSTCTLAELGRAVNKAKKKAQPKPKPKVEAAQEGKAKAAARGAPKKGNQKKI